MEPINAVTAECFNALMQLREIEGALSSPETVHNQLSGFVDALKEKARSLAFTDRDVEDIAYALVAFADEIALSKPDPLRSHWMKQPLQLLYYNEVSAGEGFFERLHALRKDPARVDVLRVYYLCLMLGFQGRYSMRTGDLELMRLGEMVRDELKRVVEIPDVLSPAGEPADEPLIRSAQRNIFLWLSLGIFALAIAVFVGLQLSLNAQVADVAERLEQPEK